MAQGRLFRAQTWWLETPRLIRRWSIALLLFGFLLLALGLWSDMRGWWEGHEFLTNLVSSFTSLCFGVPAALLVFSHLGQAQEEARQKTRARAHAVQEINEFTSALLEPFNATDIQQLGSKLRGMRANLRTVRTVHMADAEREEAVATFFMQFNDLVPNPSARRPIDSFSTMHRYTSQWTTMRKWQTRVTSQCRILDEEVRPRVTDSGLPWLAQNRASDVRQAARWLFMEGRNPWKPRAQQTDNGRDGSTMAAMNYFLDDLIGLCAGAEALASLYRA
ncbi:hypothetical protein ACIP4U_07410 [Streptomyces caelestis]|uniref:hypothetical protein n=1 Tax=Streptomyces caelestis TaxID=36816 RepID=UPI003822E9C4